LAIPSGGIELKELLAKQGKFGGRKAAHLVFNVFNLVHIASCIL
jgi:hypothetical protein